MPRLWTFAWRSLAARPLRSLLTVAGIALGVAVLFAGLATNAGIDESIARTVRGLVGRADLRISAFEQGGLSRVTESNIRETPGIALAVPQVERRTFISLPIETPPELLEQGPVSVLGIDPALDGRLHDLVLTGGVTLAPDTTQSALISERLARETGLRLGDEIGLTGSSIEPRPELERFRVIGLLAGDGPLIGVAGRTVVVPIEAARALFELEGVTRVDVAFEPGASRDAVEAQLEQRLVSQPYVVASPADIATSLRASTADFQAMTALVAAIALFVGAFLIFNTLSMTVVERVREVGLLRAAGTTARQVNGLILLQAAGLGVAGSIGGVVLGLGLASLMAGYVRSIESIPLEGLVVPLGGLLLAFLIGTLVTLAAAIEPAWRAGRIPPIEALRARVDPAVGLRARLRWLVVVVGAVAVAGYILWPRGSTPSDDVIRPLVVYAILLGTALVTPFVLGPLGRLAGIPFGAVLAIEERLTRGTLVRDRSRTALTVGALTIGLAMIVAIGAVAQNARRAATAWLDGVIPGSDLVTSIRPIPLDEFTIEDLAAVDGVARVSPITTFDVAFRGFRLDAAAVVGLDLLEDGRLTFVDGERETALIALDEGGVAVLPAGLAGRLGLAVGDVMGFIRAGETVELEIVGIVERTIPGRAGEAMLVGWPDAIDVFGVEGAELLAVRFAPGREADARPVLEATARSLALEPSTLDRVEGAISAALGRVFGLFDALAVVAVIVAGLGIVNTLAMNVVERVREIGVLRATGMTGRQVWRMVVVEAGVLGVIGAIMGTLAGLAAGVAMVGLAGGTLRASLEPPWTAIALAAVLGVAVAMLAAAYPARLASRVSIVRAVRSE